MTATLIEDSQAEASSFLCVLGDPCGERVITRSESGKTFRQVRSAWSQEWEADDAPKPLKMPFQDVLVGDLLGAIEEHDIEALIHSGAGQSIAYFNDVKPVAEIMDALVEDAVRALEQQRAFIG